jgi:nucleoside phosphorylase
MPRQPITQFVQAQIDDSFQDTLIDHILKFDPLDPTTSLESSSPQPLFLIPTLPPAINWKDINKKWIPKPKPNQKKPAAGAALPVADVLIVTWTVAEALALSDALTPGKRSKTDWFPYTHNWLSDFKPKVHGMAPSLQANRLGLWYMSQIGTKQVICFKSDLHMARDGKDMPVKDLWIQLIKEVQPKLVITTGTAGGIGKGIQLGDVVVTKTFRFDCNRTFKNSPFHDTVFTCDKKINLSQVKAVNSKLMGFTTDKLPQAKRKAQIITKALAGIKPIDIVTTDFFAFDDDTNDYKLAGLGAAVEMGDATLGLACQEIGTSAPAWIGIRNASDPQIDKGSTLKEKADIAGRIYEKYGYWTTINSAIACWAVVTSLK